MSKLQTRKKLGEYRLSEKESEIAADFLEIINNSRSKADLVRASVTFSRNNRPAKPSASG